MKIAIPIKMNKEDSALAPLFGKAKWFALIENEKLQIVSNPATDGQAVIEWLAKIDVDTIIMQEMGKNPYHKVRSYGTIKLFHAGYERVLLPEILEAFKNGYLKELGEERMSEIIAHHELRHPPHDHHGHHHHA